MRRDDPGQPRTPVPGPRHPSKPAMPWIRRYRRQESDGDLPHNHPSGDPTPSRADIEMTKEVGTAAKALGIEAHDHLVIDRRSHASFKSLGPL
ncbi:MAG: hypothetical protein JNL07_10965 [Rhodospirillales bacterium]|nr:hypothetical protein [Rhodospirillales bacterium]